MRARQYSFLPPAPQEHGGDFAKGKRKSRRPFDPKRPLHIVLRSTRARGAWSLLKPGRKEWVEKTAREIAVKHGVRLYRYANVGNHLHLLVLARFKRDFQAFLREVAGIIASAVTGARKGSPMGRFWDMLAYSRLVTWGRDFRNIDLYFIRNLFEAAGLLSARAKAAGARVIPLGGWIGAPPGRAAQGAA